MCGLHCRHDPRRRPVGLGQAGNQPGRGHRHADSSTSLAGKAFLPAQRTAVRRRDRPADAHRPVRDPPPPAHPSVGPDLDRTRPDRRSTRTRHGPAHAGGSPHTPGHTGPVRGVAISPDGTWLATASFDQTVRVWDLASGHTRATLIATPASPGGRGQPGRHLARIHERPTLRGHKDRPQAVAISSDGTWLATAGADHTARTWDATTGGQRATLRGSKGAVESMLCLRCAWTEQVGDRLRGHDERLHHVVVFVFDDVAVVDVGLGSGDAGW